MKGVPMILIAILLAGPLAACGDGDGGRKTVSDAEVARVVTDARKESIPLTDESVRAALGKVGCNIVLANGIGGADPHVIVAGDTTPANDAARYFKGLATRDRKAIEDAVRNRALQSFVCVGSCGSEKACSKDVRISYGSGHLPKLNKDVYIIQAERSCQCA